jgi:hypothetical protein
MLQRLTIPPIQAAIHIGEVALIFHGQLTSPKRAGTITAIACASAETRTIVLPKGVEVVSQLLHRIAWHAPAIRVEQVGRESRSVIL